MRVMKDSLKRRLKFFELLTKGAPGIDAMTRGRGGEGGSEGLKKFSSHFSKFDF